MSPIVKYPRIPKLSARHILVCIFLILGYAAFEFNRVAELKKARINYESATQRNDPKAAIGAIDNIMRLDGKDAAGFVNRAYYHAELEDLPKAIEDYDKALEIDPDCVDALVGRGRLFYGLVQYEKAVADYSQALSLDPKNQVAYRIRGCSYSQLGKMDNAFADFKKALELDPTDGRTYFVRGTSHQKAEQFEQAVQDYTEAIRAAPRLAKPCYELRASLYERLGKLQLAKDDRKHSAEAKATDDDSDFGSDLLDQEVLTDAILSELTIRGYRLDEVRGIDHVFCSPKLKLTALIDAVKQKGVVSDPNAPISEADQNGWVTFMGHDQIRADHMHQRTEELMRLAYKLGAHYCGWSADLD